MGMMGMMGMMGLTGMVVGKQFENWNLDWIRPEYYVMLRNYNGYLQHKRLDCTSFQFHRVSPVSFFYEFSGVTPRSNQLRVFDGVLLQEQGEKCLKMSTFPEDSDSSVVSDVVDASTICIIDADMTRNGTWYLVSDSSHMSTFGMVTNLSDTRAVEELYTKAALIFPTISFQNVTQGREICTYYKPPLLSQTPAAVLHNERNFPSFL
jgi:hypothetical protein